MTDHIARERIRREVHRRVDPVIIDTDPGLGLPHTDVDDAIAIYTLVKGGAPIAGLTSTYGNTSITRTHPITEELGKRWNIPVFRGASGPGDVATAATEALLAHTGSVLAIGAMTNIAAALDGGARWSQLILLGGTVAAGPNIRGLRTTELNFAVDEPAAARALSACTTLFSMEPCRQVLFRAAEFAALPAWMEQRCRGWLRLGPLMTGHRGVHPWDVLPAMWLLKPDLFRSEKRGVALRSGALTRGHIAYGDGEVDVITHVDAPAFVNAWRSVIE